MGECKSSENDDFLIPPMKSSRNQSRNRLKTDQIEVPRMMSVKSNPALLEGRRKYSSGKEYKGQIFEDPIEHSEEDEEAFDKNGNDSTWINQSVLNKR